MATQPKEENRTEGPGRTSNQGKRKQAAAKKILPGKLHLMREEVRLQPVQAKAEEDPQCIK